MGRSFWARYLAALLLLGGVHWHGGSEALESHLVVQAEVYYPDLPWHGDEVHVDPAVASSTREPCPVCLLQLQTGGAESQPVAGIAPPLVALWRTGDDPARRSDGDSLACSARGPPSRS